MTAAAIHDVSKTIAYTAMALGDQHAALAALVRAGAPSDLIGVFAPRLHRAPDGTFLVALEIPRFGSYPDPKALAPHNFERWLLEILKDPAVTDPCEAAWIASETRLLPISEAVAIVASAESPLRELAERQSEVARRRAERAKVAAAERAERERAQAADRSWAQRNEGRVRRWAELPTHLQVLAAAADTVGDELLQRFAAAAIELHSRAITLVRPPEWLWPTSGPAF